MYSRKERGIEAAWLRQMRKPRWSNVHKAVADFEAETGHKLHYSRWAAYESGSKPIRDEHMDAFIAYFGSDPDVPPPTPTDSDLAAAIREQAAAIGRLAAALERDKEQAPVWAQAVVSAVLAGRQLLPEDVERNGPHGSDVPQRDRA
jgi:hypothetical protein